MAVLSYREVLPRTLSHKFGESPTSERKFVVSVDEPTSQAVIIQSLGILHGAVHPEYGYLLMLDASMSETDRHQVEVTFRYEVPKQEKQDPNPLARPDVWSFTTGGAAVPALTYYHGDGNGDVRALQNTAKDFFEGLMTDEAEVRASIAGNRGKFPLAAAASITNCVNSDRYLGGGKHTWKCCGISGQQATEIVNSVEIRYWQITVELVYRRSGWSMLLPNVGWNYLEGGQKQRAWVLSEGERVASGSPRALKPDGSLKDPDKAPDILVRRLNPEAAFGTWFGTPTL